MHSTKRILFLCLLCITGNCFSQTDPYPGTWRIEFNQAGASPVIIELNIAAPEKNILYPAQLNLQCDDFKGTYILLLAKKNIRHLGIGKNKVAVSEEPFSLGRLPVFLNGIFDLSRDNKGELYLSAERLFLKKLSGSAPDTNIVTKEQQALYNRLSFILKDATVKLKKLNNLPWQSELAYRVLHNEVAGDYYSIHDSVHTKDREAAIEFTGSKKNSNGTVSLMLNGNGIIDQNDLGYKKPKDEMLLDTGINILVLFADNYGRSPATTGKLEVKLGKKKLLLDFADLPDLDGTFIVARIYYEPPVIKDLQQTIRADNPIVENTLAAGTNSAPTTKENSLLRDATLIGSIIVNTQQITLAIWDDAVEDGDSISLSINGKWIAQGFAVKKKPQFLSVALTPGPNKITFIADNLGSIIPNTSILEIIDGKKRRSFMIDTDLRQNNAISIYYDFKPGG